MSLGLGPAFLSTEEAWARAERAGLSEPPCALYCFHPAIGLLDGHPCCLDCLERELEGGVPWGVWLDREQRLEDVPPPGC